MARKTATYLACDGAACRETIEIADIAVAPDGWYRVYSAHDEKYQRDSWEFHSLRCLERWARERRLVVQDSPSRPGLHSSILSAIDAAEAGFVTSPELQGTMAAAQSTIDRALRQLVSGGVLTQDGSQPRRYRRLVAAP
jgi:hypothetical protein